MDDPDSDLRTMLDELNALRQDLNTKTRKIDGVNVTINGTMAVAIKGTMVNSEASAQHQTKGAIVVSKGSATNTLEGGTVLLNP
jgi:aerobic-type carbon monoxide dehydrogenase small subunit (CoxS/CutS family)